MEEAERESVMQDFIFSNDFYKSIDLMVTMSGHEKCAPGHSYGPAVRSSYLFHYVHSGKGIFEAKGKTWEVGPGDIFLMEPGERIFYKADEEDPWEYSWLGLQGVKAEDYLKRTSLLEIPVVHVSEQSKIPGIVRIVSDIKRGLNSDLALNATAYAFLYELSEEFPHAISRQPIEAEGYVEMILSYIEQNFEQPITIQEIADQFALDRSYVYRIFKKRMNMSVKEYILSLRLASACSLLIHTDLPISDIARSVGYDDVLYFSRLFHRKKGCSPSQYRHEKSAP